MFHISRTAAVALLLLVTACGPNVESSLHELPYLGDVHVQAECEQYYGRWERETGIPIMYVSCRIEPLNMPNVVGVCETLHRYKAIRLDAEWWKVLGAHQREQLMFHELGHCVLGRGHDTELHPDGRPMSIMFPNLLKAHVYGEHRHEYIKELTEHTDY